MKQRKTDESEKQLIGQEWLESADNLRPAIKNNYSKPKAFRYRVRIQDDERPATGTFSPPLARLRSDEAFQNASRDRETHIFTNSELIAATVRWSKKIPPINDDEIKHMDPAKITVAQLMKPVMVSDTTDQFSRIKLRGEEGMDNRMRGQGSLSLKTISVKESADAVRQQVHVRCTGDEALDNREWGQRGTGVSSLMDCNQTREPMAAPQPSRRAIRSEEAVENWNRDHLKECTEMEHVLNHGWSSCNREVSGIRSRTQSAISSHTMTCPPWGTLDQGKLTGERPKTAARGVSREGAIYALREGSAMADRMGLKQTSGAQFASVDPVELNEIRENAIHSSDEQPARHGPKARLDGLEYAMNGRGTLTTGLIPATRALSETITAPRLKGDAYEIAKANNGDGSKLLLSNWRLKPDQQPPVRPIPNSRNIRDRSRGAEARSCLNPTRPKWSGKVHWKRRSPAPVHSTF